MDKTKLVNLKKLLTHIVNSLRTTSYVPDITPTTGTLVSCTTRRCGNVVQMYLAVNNSNTVQSNAPIFEGDLGELIPRIFVVNATYYGSRTIAGSISSTGAILIRNTSSSSLSMTSAIGISFTYIV